MHDRTRLLTLATAMLLTMIFSGAAFGQHRQDPRTDLYQGPGGKPQIPQQVQQPIRIDQLNRLDPGIGDVSPLRRSLRQLPTGLRMPTNFSDIYAVPGRPGWFMRANGGLWAVFPQSIYEEHGPIIPHGTVFHIGTPVFQKDQRVSPDPARDAYFGTRTAPAPAKSATDVSGKQPVFRPNIRQRALAEGPPQRRNRLVARNPKLGPSIIRDRIYRRVRLRELMRRAAMAE